MSSQHKRDFRYDIVQFALKYGIKPAAREYSSTPKTIRIWVNRYKEKGIRG